MMTRTKRKKAWQKGGGRDSDDDPRPKTMSATSDFSEAAPAIFATSRRRPIGMSGILRVAFIAALAMTAIFPAVAQDKDKKGETELRTVHGSAVDKDDNPIPSTVIYLLNVRTQAVTTRITDESGNYRFSGLDPNVDYEIHAENNDMASSTRTVSSFDSAATSKSPSSCRTRNPRTKGAGNWPVRVAATAGYCLAGLCSVVLWIDAGPARNCATIGPTETQSILRCPHGESRVSTGAPIALANACAGPGFTMWS